MLILRHNETLYNDYGNAVKQFKAQLIKLLFNSSQPKVTESLYDDIRHVPIYFHIPPFTLLFSWFSLPLVFIFFCPDPPHKPTDDTTADEFRDLLNLNVIGYFLASKVNSKPPLYIMLSILFSFWCIPYAWCSIVMHSLIEASLLIWIRAQPLPLPASFLKRICAVLYICSFLLYEWCNCLPRPQILQLMRVKLLLCVGWPCWLL